ncbi:hypothetical protein E3Q18_04427 [Wallemia mellicola]|nr:hypothetical protein E3Q18_04427 [Wallemia mellicola]
MQHRPSGGDELKDIISKHDNDTNFIPTSTPFVSKKNAAFFARSTNDRKRKFKAKYSQINRILKALKAKGVSLRGAESICILTERGSGHQHRAESRAVFRHLNGIDMVFCSDATRLTRNYDDRSFPKEVFSSKALFVLIDDDVKQVVFDDLDNIQFPRKRQSIMIYWTAIR